MRHTLPANRAVGIARIGEGKIVRGDRQGKTRSFGAMRARALGFGQLDALGELVDGGDRAAQLVAPIAAATRGPPEPQARPLGGERHGFSPLPFASPAGARGTSTFASAWSSMVTGNCLRSSVSSDFSRSAIFAWRMATR